MYCNTETMCAYPQQYRDTHIVSVCHMKVIFLYLFFPFFTTTPPCLFPLVARDLSFIITEALGSIIPVLPADSTCCQV